RLSVHHGITGDGISTPQNFFPLRCVYSRRLNGNVRSVAQNFFSENDKTLVVEAIREAERDASGEIKVFVEDRYGADLNARLRQVFDELRMRETSKRNGVLIYLAVVDRKFVIWGDEGINAVVGGAYWNEIRDRMREYFRAQRFAEGVVEAVRSVGEALKRHFPRTEGEANELSDEIIIR
ncbi:MAG: TPM domain-containing protein, partial [Bacteroidia bacterium]|nr:TPM domain-containing protein [Bacteroidia bacterium]